MTSNPETTSHTTSQPSATPSTPTPDSAPTNPPLNGSAFPERVTVREDFKEEEIFTETMAIIPLETKKKLGFSVDELILDCKYSGIDCFPL
jgi:hypothetical protein